MRVPEMTEAYLQSAFFALLAVAILVMLSWNSFSRLGRATPSQEPENARETLIDQLEPGRQKLRPQISIDLKPFGEARVVDGVFRLPLQLAFTNSGALRAAKLRVAYRIRQSYVGVANEKNPVTTEQAFRHFRDVRTSSSSRSNEGEREHVVEPISSCFLRIGYL